MRPECIYRLSLLKIKGGRAAFYSMKLFYLPKMKKTEYYFEFIELKISESYFVSEKPVSCADQSAHLHSLTSILVNLAVKEWSTGLAA